MRRYAVSQKFLLVQHSLLVCLLLVATTGLVLLILEEGLLLVMRQTVEAVRQVDLELTARLGMRLELTRKVRHSGLVAAMLRVGP